MDVSTMLVQVELYLTRENLIMWTVLTPVEAQTFTALQVQFVLFQEEQGS